MNAPLRQCSTLEFGYREKVLVVHLNRPGALNAINRAMRDELRRTLDDAHRDDDTLAVVLAGNGRAFSAGHDIKELMALSPATANAVMLDIGNLYRDLRAFPKPLVAALNGMVLGGGTALALFSDLRLATPDVEFGFPEIDRGLVTALGPWLLGLFMAPARAHQIVLGGARLSASSCLTCGLISETVEQPDLLSKSIAAALSLAGKPQRAFSLTKARFAAVTETGFQEALEAGAQMQERAQEARQPIVDNTSVL